MGYFDLRKPQII